MNYKYFAFILLFAIACRKNSPIQGSYCSIERNKYAVIVDSTMYFMCGFDTAFIYNLALVKEEIENDTLIWRGYELKFSNSLTIHGYRPIICPLKFEGNENNGGIPLAIFKNNDSFKIGEYYFTRDTSKLLFDKWIGLISNNNDSKILRMTGKD